MPTGTTIVTIVCVPRTIHPMSLSCNLFRYLVIFLLHSKTNMGVCFSFCILRPRPKSPASEPYFFTSNPWSSTVPGGENPDGLPKYYLEKANRGVAERKKKARLKREATALKNLDIKPKKPKKAWRNKPGRESAVYGLGGNSEKQVGSVEIDGRLETVI